MNSWLNSVQLCQELLILTQQTYKRNGETTVLSHIFISLQTLTQTPRQHFYSFLYFCSTCIHCRCIMSNSMHVHQKYQKTKKKIVLTIIKWHDYTLTCTDKKQSIMKPYLYCRSHTFPECGLIPRHGDPVSVPPCQGSYRWLQQKHRTVKDSWKYK